jgi:hypothetical protein
MKSKLLIAMLSLSITCQVLSQMTCPEEFCKKPADYANYPVFNPLSKPNISVEEFEYFLRSKKCLTYCTDILTDLKGYNEVIRAVIHIATKYKFDLKNYILNLLDSLKNSPQLTKVRKIIMNADWLKYNQMAEAQKYQIIVKSKK